MTLKNSLRKKIKRKRTRKKRGGGWEETDDDAIAWIKRPVGGWTPNNVPKGKKALDISSLGGAVEGDYTIVNNKFVVVGGEGIRIDSPEIKPPLPFFPERGNKIREAFDESRVVKFVMWTDIPKLVSEGGGRRRTRKKRGGKWVGGGWADAGVVLADFTPGRRCYIYEKAPKPGAAGVDAEGNIIFMDGPWGHDKSNFIKKPGDVLITRRDGDTIWYIPNTPENVNLLGRGITASVAGGGADDGGGFVGEQSIERDWIAGVKFWETDTKADAARAGTPSPGSGGGRRRTRKKRGGVDFHEGDKVKFSPKMREDLTGIRSENALNWMETWTGTVESVNDAKPKKAVQVYWKTGGG